jgi:MATE family multidrug resistance protein
MPSQPGSESIVSPEPANTPALSESGSWWTRRCGGREVVIMALPMMISTFTYSLMQFCDRVFLTWFSETSVAAAMPASVMSWTFLAFPLGVAMYTNVFVAQYFGARQPDRIGQVLWHGLLLGSCFVPLYLLAIIWPEWIFDLAGHEAGLARNEAEYFRYISFGSMAQIYGAVLSGLFIGQGRTLIVMLVDSLAAGINIWLDVLLIFGFSCFGLRVTEPLGITGAAIATSIALWIKFALLVMLCCRRETRQAVSLFVRFRLQPQLLIRMVRFGSSNGWQMLIECLGIAIFSLMIGRLGEIPAAATTLAISVNMLVFVPVWGLSTAVSTLVGQQIGNARPDLAERATWSALIIGLVYTSLFAVMYLSVPDWFLVGFDSGPNSARIHEVVRNLLLFVALFCLLDTVQIVFVGAIKGAGDTRYVVLASIVCSSGFVLFGLVGHRAISHVGDQLYWWWWALTGWILMLAIAYTFRFWQGRWKTKKVIEDRFLPDWKERERS